MSAVLDILRKSSLDPKMAEIYLILANNGKQTVPEIQQKTELSRTTIYEVLTELLAKGLIEYEKKGRVAYYSPNHPNKLYALVEEKKQDTVLFETEMKEVVSSLTGAFQLHSARPGVRFFEGEDGLFEAISDSLTAKSEILSYINISSVRTHAKESNDRYLANRMKMQKRKRMLLANNEENLAIYKNYSRDHTDARMMPKKIQPFAANMQIYDNKIAFFTLREDNMIAVIIEDAQLAEMQRNFFEFIWEQSN